MRSARRQSFVSSILLKWNISEITILLEFKVIELVYCLLQMEKSEKEEEIKKTSFQFSKTNNNQILFSASSFNQIWTFPMFARIKLISGGFFVTKFYSLLICAFLCCASLVIVVAFVTFYSLVTCQQKIRLGFMKTVSNICNYWMKNSRH